MHRRAFLAGLVAGVFLLSPLTGRAEEGGWEHDTTEQGVVVTTRTEAGRNLPIFRGVTTMDANVYEILAVLDDIGKFTNWIASCVGARVIKQVNEFERIEYNRTGAPWPVSDRDTVIRSWIEANATRREIWARFQSVNFPGAGPVDGVVRMPRLRGFYHLEALDDTHTRVTYQVDADPGGMLPDWLVKRTSRRLPIDTLVGLKRQVGKTRGRYEAFIKRYDPAKGGKVPEQFAK